MALSTVEDVAAAVAAAPGPLRPAGLGTRAGWGGIETVPVTTVDTTGLDQILEHNPGDFTAVVQAGAPLDSVQAALAAAGQWLAVDPPTPGTIGGLVATADSGPCRHRYGGLRDLVIGITVVLADGSVASAGGKVIKNVAGYDLGKLFTGSLGTLGLIASVALRLHPRPVGTVTVTATTDGADALGRVAIELSRRPLEALSLDAWWDGDAGGLLLRFQGVSAAEQAHRARALLGPLSDVSIVEDDEPLWTMQRARQRSAGGVVVKVSGRPTDLPRVVATAREHGATVASRAGLGLSWLAFPPADDAVARAGAARAALAPRATTVLDGGDRVADPWPIAPGLRELTRRVKARFDPMGTFRPGVGGV